MILLVILVVLAILAIAATVSAVLSDGYGQRPTDWERVPDRDTVRAAGAAHTPGVIPRQG
ncbi:hypothetical protein [Microbacterium gilvum]|uniref:Uncharacterized protein n=1 Tax=Microbacterium gilvum TaxID=1336204 RepID=A0ABP9A1G9_9MICO